MKPRSELEQELLRKRFAETVSSKYGIFRDVVELPLIPGDVQLFMKTSLPAGWKSANPDFNVCVGQGAGLDSVEAEIRSNGEAIDRYCARTVDPASLIREKSYREWKNQGISALGPSRFQWYADWQYRQPGFACAPFTEDLPMTWVKGTRVRDGSSVMVPASLVYLTKTDDRGIAKLVSTGLACHSSAEEAIRTGLLEVMERDAFLFSWWTRTPFPQIDLASADRPRLKKLMDSFRGPDRFAYALLLDVKLPVPVVVVNLRGKNRSGDPAFTMGMSCNPDIGLALEKAFMEAAHCFNIARFRRQECLRMEFASDPDHAISGFRDVQMFYFRDSNAERTDFLLSSGQCVRWHEIVERSRQTDSVSLASLAGALATHGLDPIAVDVTTRDIRFCGFHVFKVLVPGLIPLNPSHFYRPWGEPRIFRLKADLGLCDRVLGPTDLNPDPQPMT